ncbi:hypothetical protein JOC78_001178 [Bacillus ectoiniformans]|uniref:staygreen family protein n=1 Tax=Bacillus ectoiniformans TaxID=1494429 RepID=UPI001958F0DC|nr:hypothetical protein [Bacillus ectoiniformans]
MSVFNPEKLFVEYRGQTTAVSPIVPRKYTLTHSDITGDLFLTVGPAFAFDKINEMRDEVLAKWQVKPSPALKVYLHVDGAVGGQQVTAFRDAIFRRELPLALQAIRFGDRAFFMAHPEFDQAPILVAFQSKWPQYNRTEYWGTPASYRTDAGIQRN